MARPERLIRIGSSRSSPLRGACGVQDANASCRTGVLIVIQNTSNEKGPPLGTLCHLARPERLIRIGSSRSSPLRGACGVQNRCAVLSNGSPPGCIVRSLRAKTERPLTRRGLSVFGAPGEIRTPDRLVRSQVLYPAELRAHCPVCGFGPASQQAWPAAGPHILLIRPPEVKSFSACGTSHSGLGRLALSAPGSRR